MVTFKHSTLGTLRGVSPTPNVVQYRCIPYASIPARFKHSQLIDHIGDFDATQYGYHSIHHAYLVRSVLKWSDSWRIKGGDGVVNVGRSALRWLKWNLSV
jgi:hypothetical protein